MTRALLTALDRLRGRLRTAPAEVADGDLLSRYVRLGDGEAFAALVSRHGPMVLGVCRRVLGDAAAAEDAFQATFLVLARRAGRLERSGSVAGWLHAVARHAALRARAAAARRREREGKVMAKPSTSPDDRADWEDLRPILDRELARLPGRYREAVVLCYLEGRSTEEAAGRLGCPVGSVKSSLARARDLLRDRLTRRGVALSAAGLTTLLTTEALTAAVPPALAGMTKTVATGAAGATTLALAEGVLSMLRWNQVKSASLWAAALLAVVGGGSAVRQALAARPPETLAAALTPLPAADDPPARAQPMQYYPPLGVLHEQAKWDAKLPAAIVGRPAADISGAEAIQSFTAGALELQSPRAGRAAWLFVVSDALNTGETAEIVRLTRQGNQFTLTAVAYRDDGERRKNIPALHTFLIPLGHLDAGEYEVRVVWCGLLQKMHALEDGQPDPCSRLDGRKEGRLSFTVLRKEDAEPDFVPALRGDALKAPLVAVDEQSRCWQRPIADDSSIVRPNEIAHPNGLQVGRYVGDRPGASRTLGKVEPVKAAEPVSAVIVGPRLNSGEKMVLREVEWKGKEAILRVDLWRDHGPRDKNIVSTANLVAALNLPPRPDGKPGEHAVGEYKVRVEWTLLRAPNLGEPYVVEDPNSAEVKKLREKVLNVGNPATFTIE